MAVFLGLLASANARILLGNTLDNSGKNSTTVPYSAICWQDLQFPTDPF